MDEERGRKKRCIFNRRAKYCLFYAMCATKSFAIWRQLTEVMEVLRFYMEQCGLTQNTHTEFVRTFLSVRLAQQLVMIKLTRMLYCLSCRIPNSYSPTSRPWRTGNVKNCCGRVLPIEVSEFENGHQENCQFVSAQCRYSTIYYNRLICLGPVNEKLNKSHFQTACTRMYVLVKDMA